MDSCPTVPPCQEVYSNAEHEFGQNGKAKDANSCNTNGLPGDRSRKRKFAPG